MPRRQIRKPEYEEQARVMARLRRKHLLLSSRGEKLFWTRLEIGEGCWLWTGKKSVDGYGMFSNTLAHRLMYALTVGPVSNNLYVLHHCDVRACVRPDHLFLGTHTDNMRDMWSKGRTNRSERSFVPTSPHLGKTHCKNGHELSGDNVRLTPEGFRRCVQCSRVWNRQKHARRKAALIQCVTL